MKTYLVVNPRSANGETGKRWLELSARIGQVIGDFGHGFTAGAMDAKLLCQRAIESGYECIVAVGGDGTVNEVTNGFFHAGKAINPKAALGLIPRGTGGDFRRAFGWGQDLESALERLRTDRTEPFDVGEASYAGWDGETERRYFANIASMGVSAVIADEVNRASKALGGRFTFAIGTVRGMLKYTERPIFLSFDGKPAERFETTAIAVANGQYFGGGMKVAPDASTSDGLFDVTVWSGYSTVDFIVKSKGVYSGEHVNWKGTKRFQCRTLTATTDQETLLDVDGEVPGRLPCTMTLLPGALRLKV